LTNIGLPIDQTIIDFTNTLSTWWGVVSGPATNETTNTITVDWSDIAAWVQTNMPHNAPEVRQLDAYYATLERETPFASKNSAAYLYRRESENLQNLKTVLEKAIEERPASTARWVASNAWDVVTYLTTHDDVTAPAYSLFSTVLSEANAPTNWAYVGPPSSTPHRWLEGVGPTNASILTNAYTYGAFTVMDYGWRHWTNVASYFVAKNDGQSHLVVTDNNDDTVDICNDQVPTNRNITVAFFGRDATNVVWTHLGSLESNYDSEVCTNYARVDALVYHSVYFIDFDFDY